MNVPGGRDRCLDQSTTPGADDFNSDRGAAQDRVEHVLPLIKGKQALCCAKGVWLLHQIIREQRNKSISPFADGLQPLSDMVNQGTVLCRL